MEKITLNPGETIAINDVIISSKIIDFLLDLQLGIDHPGMPARENNIGIEEYQESYNHLILFMASEAGNFNDKEQLISWFDSITSMRDMWNRFRVPVPNMMA